MRLNRSHLQVLLAIHEEITYQELAKDLDISTSYAKNIVAELVKQGLLKKGRDGRRVTITPSDSKVVELLHRLDRRHGHIDWDELLAGKAVEILFYLDQSRTASEVAERSDNYRNTVYRILNRFQDRGIIAKDGTRYMVPEEFDLLVAVAREYVHHRHRNTIRDTSPRATIIWEDTEAVLIQTTDTIEGPGYYQTGPAGFEQFALPLLTTDTNYYFHTDEDWELDPASLVCHTLLIDDGPRYRSYCLLLLAQEDPDCEELRATADRYGLEEIVEDLLAYLDSEGQRAAEGQPDWDELETLADEYGVTL